MLRGGRSRVVGCCALAGAVLLALAGCGKGEVVGPLPQGGVVPKAAPAPVGNPTAGKAVFASAGCGARVTRSPLQDPPARSARISNDLTAEAAKAGEPLEAFIKESIITPGAYIAPGYKDGIMPPSFGTSLKPQQLADLVAFLNQSK